MMKLWTVPLLLSIAAMIGVTSFSSSASFADQANETSGAATGAGDTTELSGSIGSIQNDQEGTQLWVTTGHWQLQLDGPLPTQSNGAQANVTAFNATLHMAMLTNGSALHKHEIYDFAQKNITQTGDKTTIIHGLMTIAMMDGTHENVPGFIRISGNVISIWPDAAAVNKHFGTTPIYGIVIPESDMSQQATNMTSTAGNNATDPCPEFDFAEHTSAIPPCLREGAASLLG